MTIAVIPRDFSTEMVVEVPFLTAVAESESGVSGRKSTRNIPLRKYNLTVNPDNAEEVLKLVLAHRGARYPVALRDYAGNYTLNNDAAVWDATLSKFLISKNFIPATGARTYNQRVLIMDTSEVSTTVKVNGSPTSFTITDPGILNVSASSGDAVTVTGQYLVPVVFVDDSIPFTVHIDNLFSIQNLNLREIGETELVNLTA